MTVYGETDPRRGDDRVGVIAFNIRSRHHALVAAILGYEAGIGVRSGCFCAQIYVALLLGLADVPADRLQRPGMVRLSLGAFNTIDDIDSLVAMVERITHGDYQGDYLQLAESGDFRPASYDDRRHRHFALTGAARPGAGIG